MSRPHSSYYPQRANWLSTVAQGTGKLRRQLALDRLHFPDGISFWAGCSSFFVPGLAWYLRWPASLGIPVLALCALLLLGFFVCLGLDSANYIIGALLSIHATGLVILLGSLLAYVRLPFRMALSLAVLLLLSCALYLPARNFLESHLLMPLSVGNKVIVVRRTSNPGVLKRGDWVALRVDERFGGNVRAYGGFALAPVLALPGDHVRFEPSFYTVNGARHPSLPLMPDSGAIVVPQYHWLAWPELDIRGRNYASEDRISARMLEIAVVRHENVIGKPFERWFMRRQMPL